VYPSSLLSSARRIPRILLVTLGCPAPERDRRAKVVHARGEFEAAQHLADVAERTEGHPATHLRILSTMAEISSERKPLIGMLRGSEAAPSGARTSEAREARHSATGSASPEHR
jgi:hypothetical protein